MDKFTPGPWEFRQEDGVWKIHADGKSIMCDEQYYPWVPNKGADWHLIAAAPDLLEALILLEAEMVASGNADSVDYGWKPAIEKTRAAIAKARGQS